MRLQRLGNDTAGCVLYTSKHTRARAHGIVIMFLVGSLTMTFLHPSPDYDYRPGVSTRLTARHINGFTVMSSVSMRVVLFLGLINIPRVHYR